MRFKRYMASELIVGKQYELKFSTEATITVRLDKISTNNYFPSDYYFYYISGNDELIKASPLRDKNLFPLLEGIIPHLLIREIKPISDTELAKLRHVWPEDKPKPFVLKQRRQANTDVLPRLPKAIFDMKFPKVDYTVHWCHICGYTSETIYRIIIPKGRKRSEPEETLLACPKCLEAYCSAKIKENINNL